MRSSRATRDASRIPARDAGRSRPPSRRACRRTSSPRRSTSASRRAGQGSSATACSPRCAQASAVTTRRRSPDVAHEQSDALVIFGATGDLAFKKIFPALHAMVKRGRLDVPVVTVGRDPLDGGRIHARAKESIEQHGGGVDPAAFEKLAQRLLYVGGDYTPHSTFAAIRAALGVARHPTFYLAIPPSAFATVVGGLARTGCAEGGRVVLEKPFGRDLASARELNRILHTTFGENAI